MIYNGLPPEAARGILPNATATKIIISMNLRALMHFIKIRGSNRAHPDIRWFSNRLKEYFSCKYPVIFNQ
jgi:thymidylate synthase (FAD)